MICFRSQISQIGSRPRYFRGETASLTKSFWRESLDLCRFSRGLRPTVVLASRKKRSLELCRFSRGLKRRRLGLGPARLLHPLSPFPTDHKSGQAAMDRSRALAFRTSHGSEADGMGKTLKDVPAPPPASVRTGSVPAHPPPSPGFRPPATERFAQLAEILFLDERLKRRDVHLPLTRGLRHADRPLPYRWRFVHLPLTRGLRRQSVGAVVRHRL